MTLQADVPRSIPMKTGGTFSPPSLVSVRRRGAVTQPQVLEDQVALEPLAAMLVADPASLAPAVGRVDDPGVHVVDGDVAEVEPAAQREDLLNVARVGVGGQAGARAVGERDRL